MLRQIAQHAVSGHAAVYSHAAATLYTWTHRSWLPRPRASSQQQHRQMSGAVEDVTSFVKEVRLHQQESSRAGVPVPGQRQLSSMLLAGPLPYPTGNGDPGHPREAAAGHSQPRQAPDRGLAGKHCCSLGRICSPRAQFSCWAAPVPTVCLMLLACMYAGANGQW